MRSESAILWALAMFLLMSARLFLATIPGSPLGLVLGLGSMVASALIVVEIILHQRGTREEEARTDE